MNLQQNLPIPTTPFLDSGGKVSRLWIYFFQALWNRTGGSEGVDIATVLSNTQPVMFSDDSVGGNDGADVMAIPGPSGNPGIQGAPGATIAPDDVAVDELLVAIPVSAPAAMPIPVTVAASPFLYQSSANGQAAIAGGAVSNVEFSRDSGSTFYPMGSTGGAVGMRAGDQLRVTYTIAPTMTFIPM